MTFFFKKKKINTNTLCSSWISPTVFNSMVQNSNSLNIPVWFSKISNSLSWYCIITQYIQTVAVVLFLRTLNILSWSQVSDLNLSILIFFFLAIIQKRLKKEKKAKRKLQEALEFETKRREQAEQTLKQAASTDSLRVLNGKKLVFASVLLTFNLSAQRSWFYWKFKAWWEGKKIKKKKEILSSFKWCFSLFCFVSLYSMCK